MKGTLVVEFTDSLDYTLARLDAAGVADEFVEEVTEENSLPGDDPASRCTGLHGHGL